MLILKDVQSEIRVVMNVALFVEEEESFRVNGPTWGWGIELGRCDQIGCQSGDS